MRDLPRFRNLFLPAMLLGLALFPAAAFAQVEPLGKNVDAREVVRRGDLVQHVTEDAEDVDPTTYTIGQIAATPDTDIDKWFLTVIGQKGCVPCKKLMEDWKTNATLRAYAVPESAKDSWAHFTYYDYDDPLQSWRWKQSAKNPNPIKITAFPTILLQPPRSGKYGKPTTVVYKAVYESAENFHQGVNSAIKQYVQKLERRSSGPPSVQERIERPLIGGFRAEETAADFDPFRSHSTTIGQQQIPPLVLPLDTQPPAVTPDLPESPAGPVRNLISALGQTEIVVLLDKEQDLTPQQTRAIDDQVKALQPAKGKPHKVIKRDVSQYGKAYGVSPDEAPVVLQMDGKKVAQKLVARVPNGDEENRESMGFLFMVLTMFMGGGTALLILPLIKFVFWMMVLFVVGIVVVVLLATLSRRQAAPVAAPGPTAEQIAAAMIALQAKPATTATTV